ncbi:hypothetical protein K488DRAFT_78698 [Vararia minispora EC-137]|uniref:Uncharacterized protein n=1 Tax=Vararia minispora EC-137 TaxID=1314806 RepID=A0ACB8QK61_9AGAM|nr:hypothetical protein K488DRAFT_78698 [Vararia minispora EC-137]
MAYTASPISLSYEDHYRLCSTLSSSTMKIITAAPARLYEARYDSPLNAWESSRIKGIVVFGHDSAARSSRRHTTSYWFKIVDIRRGKILWEHDVHQLIEYEAEMPFFHSLSAKPCKFGFRFDEDEDAAIFFQEVAQRVAEICKPFLDRPLHTPQSIHTRRRPVDRSMISAPVPQSFEHVSHMDGDHTASFNVAPEWSKLLQKLEGYGVDAEMVEENFEFVKGFLAGAEAMRSSPTSSPKMTTGTRLSPSSSRTSSVESFDRYEHNPNYYAHAKQTRNIASRKPMRPPYQYSN